MDICGHASLTSFNILDELGYLKVNQFYHFNRFNSYCFT
ncbi:MAG TPA: hypothetical protein GX498_07995 [Clostridiales bacterium]|nr:hypothetical protein [Clostridiales bacterium]